MGPGKVSSHIGLIEDELLARTMKTAQTDYYDKFKTTTMYDGIALHPEWLG